MKKLSLFILVLHEFSCGMNNIKPDVNGTVPGSDLTLLNFACAYNHIKEAVILLKAGANPNIPAPNGNLYKGNYPLHFAAMHLNDTMKELLIEHGAKPELKNEAGITASELEKKMRNFNQLVDGFMNQNFAPSKKDS